MMAAIDERSYFAIDSGVKSQLFSSISPTMG
jgi:hypothetical protein